MAGSNRKASTSIHQGMMMRNSQRSEYNDNLLRVNQREENRLHLELEQWERAQRLTSKGRDKESQWFRQKQSLQTGPKKYSLQETVGSDRDKRLIPDYHFSRAYSGLADANGLDSSSNGVAAARKEGQREEGEGPDTRKSGAGRQHTRRTSHHQHDDHRRTSKHGSGGHRLVSQTHQSHPKSHQGGGQQRASKQHHADHADNKSKSDLLEGKNDTDVKTHGSGGRKGNGDVTTTTKDKDDDIKPPQKVHDTAGLRSVPSSSSNNAKTTTSGKTATEKSSRSNSSISSSTDDRKNQAAGRTPTTSTTTTTSSSSTTKTAVGKTPETIIPATVTTTTSVTSIPGGVGFQGTGLYGEGLGEAYDPRLSWDGRRRYANVWDTLSTPKNFSQVRSVRERLQREFTQSPSSADSKGRRRTGARTGSGGRTGAGDMTGAGGLSVSVNSKKSSNTASARRPTKTAL